MAQPTTTNYSISDFLEWKASDQLVIAPKFQRRDVWVLKAKSYLIDTILKEMPIPPLFIRLNIDPLKKRVIREVVDGQQRLRTVLSYIEGDFAILKAHSPEFAGMRYADLPNHVQEKFLGYHFLVNTLSDVSDSDVLSIFARLNTYTVSLNAQELRNAAYFGTFKQTVYELAHKYNVFWTSNNIISDKQIARMLDAEVVSELIVSMIDGIRQTKKQDLKIFYERYDDEFPQAKKVIKQFEYTIDTIGDIFGDTLRYSPFRRKPLFYSLFCALYDAKFGLPKSKRTRLSLNAEERKSVAKELFKLGKIITLREPPNKYVQFIDDTRRSTADVGRRNRRHRFIWDNVLAKA